MDRVIDLKVATWPELDRRLFARGSTALSQGRRRHRRVKPRRLSLRSYVDSYSRGLRWLDEKGWLDKNISPDRRWTRNRMHAYMVEATEGGGRRKLMDNTVRIRIIGIWRVLRIMNPKAELDDLLEPLHHLSRRTQRDKSHIPSLDQLKTAGLSAMATAERMPVGIESARRYRTGLQIAWFAALGLRLANLAQIQQGSGKDLRPNPDDVWFLNFEPETVKNKQRINRPFPAELRSLVETYQSKFRPLLLAGKYKGCQPATAADLWVSARGCRQSLNSVYKQVCKLTSEELGVRVSPHCFRDAIATHVATMSPAAAKSASLALGNSVNVMERHYKHVGTLPASRLAAARLKSI